MKPLKLGSLEKRAKVQLVKLAVRGEMIAVLTRRQLGSVVGGISLETSCPPLEDMEQV